MTSRKSSDIRAGRHSAMLGTLVGWTMKLISATLRMEVRDLCGISRQTDGGQAMPPVIYALWHSRFFCVPPAWNRLCYGYRKTVALTSASKDGDMVAHAMAVFGLGAVRGSSSRRGVAALVGLKRSLQEGLDICVTPDGPRGPRYEVQPGVIKLAESTGAPVIPVHVRFTSAWRLKTWDRFVIPMPFSRVDVTFAEPIYLSRGADAETFEQTRLHLQQLMIQGADDA
jgi:lysophospholipid acyltransferase (LPLAT)-like uncharacterized protein